MPAGIQLKGERTAVLLAGAAIVLAGIAAYGGSFSGVMLYDDIPSIVENSTIHHLWPLWRVLATPATGALTTSGRPVLALSFALNHAISGDRVWSYHALNLLIHLLAGLTLFGIVRRTIAQVGTGGPPVRAVPESKAGTDGRAARPYLLATSLAFSVALLWTVHPLQTEAITYIVQRAESLMGLFYLLTLYYFIRGAEKAARRESFVWFGLCWLACLFGMATKEVMATAPLMVLFYDRTFLAGTFGEACRRRGKAYAGLAGTWLVLAVLVASTGGNRGGSVGFGIAVKWWAYGLTQFEAVARYLWLSLWPHPLVFEYGVFWVRGAGEVVPYALPVLLLLAATIWGLLRPPHAGGAGRSFGFLGAWFFGILAPSSLMPGTTQMIVEHRMYLPLAAVMTCVVLGIYGVASRLSQTDRRTARACLLSCVALAVGYGALTSRRNRIYRSGLALWGDTLAKRPDNVVAHFNFGSALYAAGQVPAAIGHFERAVQLRPDLAVTHLNLATELIKTGPLAEAVAEFEQALRINPNSSEAHNGLGIALAAMGRPDDAIVHYQEALRLWPHYAQAHDNFGNALLQLGRLPEAADQYAEAVRLEPESVRAQVNFGNVLLQLGRGPEAMLHLTEGVRLDPNLPEARAKLGDGWMEANRPDEAIAQYEAALRLRPDYVQAQNNLGIALAATGRLPDAISHYGEALRLDPDLADAHYNLANALFRLGRPGEAAAQYQAVLRLKPDDKDARARLDMARRAAAHGNRP